MKYRIFLAGFLLFAVACKESPTPVSLEEDVALLASDSLQGRETGTPGARMAADYLEKRLKDLDLKGGGDNGSYFQDFTFTPRRDPHSEVQFGEASDSSITGRNVLAFIDNGGERTVILGAHYDHLGDGGEGSLHRGEPAIHNGADDNASGVAVLLDLANKISSWDDAKDNYLFIGFSGEEMGLLGSNYFAKNPTVSLDNVSYMINFDMVGRMKPDSTLSISGTGTTPTWSQLLNTLNPGFNLVLRESGVGPSDHTSFYLQDIPVLHFFTGQHEDYHRPSDDSEKLNYQGMRSISDYVFRLVQTLENEGELAFRKTKNESEEVPRFKVALGVIPDYLFDGKGMRIDGVSEDKPAQAAGLQKGDIVIQLGDSTVVDMMSYMRALSIYETGDTTTVTVLRGTEELSRSIQF
ncbi:PDZ domain-containing protein [Robiginitalea myxolifaciens]|uniref:PDZ domain-containing protein n=1 Tax=Robiginitalea myxolifaciens TaxID=400055 RepID=A0A1I6G3J5_9FLAO|nr:M28 family peptidase [Robiginitalea myxolifaciens]SFR36783.1 PDZ domain-containing protein [Robiginitalea myxolifaciens]